MNGWYKLQTDIKNIIDPSPYTGNLAIEKRKGEIYIDNLTKILDKAVNKLLFSQINSANLSDWGYYEISKNILIYFRRAALISLLMHKLKPSLIKALSLNFVPAVMTIAEFTPFFAQYNNKDQLCLITDITNEIVECRDEFGVRHDIKVSLPYLCIINNNNYELFNIILNYLIIGKTPIDHNVLLDQHMTPEITARIILHNDEIIFIKSLRAIWITGVISL